MTKGLFRKLSFAVIFLFSLTLFSCGTAKTVYKAGADTVTAAADLIIPDEKPVLKKKVLIAPIINQTGITNNIDEVIRQILLSRFGEDKYLLISKLDKDSNQAINPRTLQYGIVIDTEQVKKAQEAGMNILISCVFHPIESNVERKGIWPFRKNRRIIGISISINAVDTTNNTLAASVNESVYLKTGEINPDDSVEWKPDINLVREGIESVLDQLCDSVSNKLMHYPWQSKIYKSENNAYIIRAGQDIGIDKSTVFELYAKGEPIESYTGDEYFILGSKLGEAGVVSVSRDKTVLGINPDIEKDNSIEVIRVKRPD